MLRSQSHILAFWVILCLAFSVPVSAGSWDEAERAYQAAKTAFEFTADGMGVEKTKEAAALGHNKAQTNLSYFYASGFYVQKDLVKSAYWAERGAEGGDLPAMVRFAEILEKGIGVEKNYKRSFEWYKKAAERGSVESLFALGRMSFYGNGTPPVMDVARRYFEKAAEAGHAESYFALYLMRVSLFGPDTEHHSDLTYLEKASELNFAPAMTELSDRIEEARGYSTTLVKDLRLRAGQSMSEDHLIRFDPRSPQ